MRALLLGSFLLLAPRSDSKVTAERNPLVGNWKLVSAQSTIDGRPQNDHRGGQTGYLVLTPEGRMMVVITDNNRKIPASEADLGELWKTMSAYTGKYRIEGGDFVTTVDVAWYPVWVGSEQRRHYKLDGDKLTIVTAPQPVGAGAQKDAMITVAFVWEREK
jgi:Lipocalin-like domain